MFFRCYSSNYHGRRLLGTLMDVFTPLVAAACYHPGRGHCRCGGGHVVAILESKLDLMIVSPHTVGGQPYAFVPVGTISLPMLFEEAAPAEVRS